MAERPRRNRTKAGELYIELDPDTFTQLMDHVRAAGLKLALRDYGESIAFDGFKVRCRHAPPEPEAYGEPRF